MSAFLTAGVLDVPQNLRSVDNLPLSPAERTASISSRSQDQYGTPFFTPYAITIDVAIDHKRWQLSGVDRAIIRYIYRLTFGHNRRDARISASRIAHETGYSQYSIEERMPVLKRRGIVVQLKPNNLVGEGALLTLNRVELWDTDPTLGSDAQPTPESGDHPTILRSGIFESNNEKCVQSSDFSTPVSTNTGVATSPEVATPQIPNDSRPTPPDPLFDKLGALIFAHNLRLGYARRLHHAPDQLKTLAAWCAQDITPVQIQERVTTHLAVHPTVRITGLGFFDDAVITPALSKPSRAPSACTSRYTAARPLSQQATTSSAPFNRSSADIQPIPSTQKLRCSACRMVFVASVPSGDPCWSRLSTASARSLHAARHHVVYQPDRVGEPLLCATNT